ncbi:MAG: photosystem reaction center subunit H [Nitratireductor sp.]|uniref:PRC-barrel domain-containing protein n=1 Tax=Nitratireductor sp. B36 TaxID=2762059 RepID=UPI000C986D33|nr:PRC-barrel domain-containing protein [Nitratireductor sp. B36]MAS15676.1 photosystem reaction center subunit H [Nitratireductor sp.]MCC5780264.1 PRC-barrel domain-containing protein [Nitratireductor sp. B36]
MFRNLLATTAIATLVATGAVAQTSTTTGTGAPAAAPTEQPTEMVVRADGHLATDLIGKTVYNGTGEEAENIGEVNDLVLDEEGEVSAIVVGVGGFLGIGQKEVALEYDLVEWAEQDGERWLVVETTAEALEAQEEFDRSAYRPMPADADVSEAKPASKDDLAKAPAKADDNAEETAMAPATDAASGDEAVKTDDMAATPAPEADDASKPVDQAADTQDQATDDTMTAAIDRSSLQEMPANEIRTEELTGTTVYGANEENIGEIGDVIISQDGKVDAIIVDVGGFLGIGEKEVAIGMDNLAFMSDGNGSLYLYTEFTEEELEQQPAYDEASYGERRDEMRMQVQ